MRHTWYICINTIVSGQSKTALYIDYKQVFLNKIYEIRKDRVISEYR